MSYIDRNLLTDERILFRTRKHLIIFFWPAVVLVICSILSSYLAASEISSYVAWAPWLVVFMIWGAVGLDYYTSEFAVTNKRVMMREGFFTRHANEMRLTAISQVNVDQNIIGQIFNFGTVSINAFGAFDNYSTIANPVTFQRVVNQELDNVLSNKQ